MKTLFIKQPMLITFQKKKETRHGASQKNQLIILNSQFFILNLMISSCFAAGMGMY